MSVYSLKLRLQSQLAHLALLLTATVALAVMGRKLEVIPSLEDYIAEHGIGAVADDGICR